jgi:hypothetical protein
VASFLDVPWPKCYESSHLPQKCKYNNSDLI